MQPEAKLHKLLSGGEPVVSATILAHAGSTPRTAGTKMLIRTDGSIVGTIGGGIVEAETIRRAGNLFSRKGAEIREFVLTPEDTGGMDMICGGRLTVLLEYIPARPDTAALFGEAADLRKRGEKCTLVTVLETAGEAIERVDRCLIRKDGMVFGPYPLPPETAAVMIHESRGARTPTRVSQGKLTYILEPVFSSGTIYMFGGGHVSRAVSRLAKTVDFRVVILDDRPEFANRERFPEADEVRAVPDFDAAFQGLTFDDDAYVVIVTRGHAHDHTVLARSLSTGAKYIGMIGSRRKRDAIYAALLAEGISRAAIDRVNSPIGLAVGAETPEEIAVSIVAELIAVRAGV